MKCINKLAIIFILFKIYLIVSVFGNDTTPTTCVEERLLDLFTKWRHGVELPFSLPPLGPIDVQSFEGQYAGFGIKMTFAAGEMRLLGVNNFTVEELMASATDTLEASGTVQFPLLTLTADHYNLKGRAYVFYSIKGSGSMRAIFRNVKLMFGIKLVPNGEGTQISDIRLNFSVDGVQINLEGSTWPINKVLNAEGIKIIESYHSTLVNAATQGVSNSLNPYLKSVKPEQITNTFVGECTNK